MSSNTHHAVTDRKKRGKKMIIDHEITTDMQWGHILNCIETLRLLAAIRPIDIDRFFREPTDTYKKYFTHELSPALHLIPSEHFSLRQDAEQALHHTIASMGKDFLKNQPLSADTW